MEETTNRQRSHSRKRQSWTVIRYREIVSFDRRHVESLRSLTIAFNPWKTGYCLGTLFMQKTLLFY
jgi:hypothetical protein